MLIFIININIILTNIKQLIYLAVFKRIGYKKNPLTYKESGLILNKGKKYY